MFDHHVAAAESYTRGVFERATGKAFPTERAARMFREGAARRHARITGVRS